MSLCRVREKRHVSQRILWASVFLGTILSLVGCYSIATQSMVVGSPEGGWVYGYVGPFTVRSLGVFLVVAVLAGALVRVSEALLGRHEWWVVLVWVLVALGLQGLLRSLTPVTFETIFASDGANAFYSVARRYSATTVLSDFSDVRAHWPLHAQSNMPGKLMLVYALKHFSRRPDVLAWLVVLVSNLGGVLMYVFVRDLFRDRRVALYSLVLYVFVPGKLFFFPLLNTVTPVILLACACLVLRWVLTGHTAYAALLGVGLYGLVFYDPLPLVMGLLFAGLVARAIWRTDISWRRFLLQSGVAVVTFVAAYATIYVWFGFDLIDAFRQIGAHALAFNAEAQRPYSIWVRENPREFLFGAGMCQAIVFWAALGDGFAGMKQRASSPDPSTGSGSSRAPSRDEPRAPSREPRATITLLCLSLAGVLVATTLIGVNRGEVIRLWIFLACFFQIPAAYVCARLENRAAMVLVVATTVLQDALGTSMIGFILPG